MRSDAGSPVQMRVAFRYGKAGRIRTYGLRADGRQIELWVQAESAGSLRSRKLVTCADEADVEPFLRDVERELREGGWSSSPGR